MENWKIHYLKLVSEKLRAKGIEHEITSFKISSDLKRARDNDWENTLTDRQIVKLIYPKRKGGKLNILATNSNDLPVSVGTVEFYNEDVEYKVGLIGFLEEKKLTYANGDTRYCLEFDQSIILIAADNVPSEVSEVVNLKLNEKGIATKSKGGLSCMPAIVIVIIILILTYLFA